MDPLLYKPEGKSGNRDYSLNLFPWALEQFRLVPTALSPWNLTISVCRIPWICKLGDSLKPLLRIARAAVGRPGRDQFIHQHFCKIN